MLLQQQPNLQLVQDQRVTQNSPSSQIILNTMQQNANRLTPTQIQVLQYQQQQQQFQLMQAQHYQQQLLQQQQQQQAALNNNQNILFSSPTNNLQARSVSSSPK